MPAKDGKFGKKLRELRLKAGLSVRELAERAGVHYSYISKLENGLLPPPGAQKTADLADALGYDRSKLLAISERVPRTLANNFRLHKSADFGAELKKLRLKRHLSQAELAARTGVSATYISKMENHAIPPPSDDVIRKLAAALRTKPRSLLAKAGKVHAYQQILEQPYSTGEARRKSMSKMLKSPLTLGRLALALVLVIAFTTAMWSVTPKPAKAITINVSNNSATATIGQPYTFTVTITVQSFDRLPLQSVDIRIESTTHPSSYTTTLSKLPIPSTPSTPDTATINGATVNVLTGSTWGAATGARGGYGYGYASSGYVTINGTGYGYGYGASPYTGGTATITYSVSWTPPSWSTSDTYRIVVLAYLTSGYDSSAFTQISPSTFTLAAAPTPAPTPTPAPAGGGGGGVVPTPAGSTGLTGSISATGVTTKEITATAPENSQVKAVIPNETTALGPDNQPLQYITVNSVDNPPATGDSQVVGIPYNFGPSGAKFDKPVTLTFPVPAGYTAEQLSRLTVAFYDVTSNTWVSLDNIRVNPDGTISGDTTHFTIFAVILQPVPTTIVTPTATATATATPTATPTITPTVTPTQTTPPSPTVTSIPIPGPTVTSTVILPPAAGTGVVSTKVNWVWPIVIGIIGAAVMFFVVRWGWNMRRD